MQLLKKKSLGYVFREVLLIFIGITCAIWFNNWNESKKERLSEIETLKEIQKAIQQDYNDIEGNVNYYKGSITLYNLILQEIEQQKIASEEVLKRLVYIKGYAVFVSNVGPYETLKSRGLEKITNADIRLEISSLYDVKYEAYLSVEETMKEHYFNYIKPKTMTIFDFGNNKTPIHYNNLKNDYAFTQSLYWAVNLSNNMVTRSKTIMENIKHLQKSIEDEINKLQ